MYSPTSSLLNAGLETKLIKLHEIFLEMGSTLIAFSGGIDSTLILKIAYDTLGEDAVAVTANSPTFPRDELEAVRKLSKEIGARLIITTTNQLDKAEFVRNDSQRCYHCKIDLYQLFDLIRNETGIFPIVDGTNLDDLKDVRPGLKAAKEFGVRSPLVEAGLTKSEVRSMAKNLGLPNWDKPAAACLSSRIPHGLIITDEKLRRVEKAEILLRQEGFRQVRVRDHDGIARIEIDKNEISRLFDPQRQHHITKGLKEIGFRLVTLDLEGYRSGGRTTEISPKYYA